MRILRACCNNWRLTVGNVRPWTGRYEFWVDAASEGDALLDRDRDRDLDLEGQLETLAHELDSRLGSDPPELETLAHDDLDCDLDLE